MFRIVKTKQTPIFDHLKNKYNIHVIISYSDRLSLKTNTPKRIPS